MKISTAFPVLLCLLLLGSGIDDADCMEICDVADDMSDETVMDTFDPPVQWTEELAEKCRNCEHRF